MKSISFFLGSGFSKPAGYPTGDDLNKALIKPENLNIENFTIKPQLDSEFTDLAEKVLEYFPLIAKFDYEQYFDFIQCLLHSIALPDTCQTERQCLERLFGEENLYKDLRNTLFKYNLQVANLLTKDFTQINIEAYKFFIELIRDWKSKGFVVNIFSLNHDLLLEYLLETGEIEYSDGFDMKESKYYYKKGGFDQKLCVYNGRFAKQVRYLKLHGSINQYKLNEAISGAKAIFRTKTDFLKFSDTIYENENHILTSNEQEFLTGTSTKKWYLQNHTYYSIIFTKFKELLYSSEDLIILGYGFKDEHIHEYCLQDYFDQRHRIIVIGKNLKNEFLNRNKGKYHTIPKYLEELIANDFNLLC